MRYFLAYAAAIFAAVLASALLTGCATVEKTVTGPGGYKYTERISATGKSNIAEATQTFGGKLSVQSPDGTSVEAELDSGASGKDLQSDNAFNEMAAAFFQFLIQSATKP